MKIACFGDSLTFGSVGYSYIKFIGPEFTVLNKGVNGDTTVCMLKRLKRFIGNREGGEVEAYVIAIGTNDLLLPYLTTVSPLWKIQMAPRVKMKECIHDDALFETEYKKIIGLLLSHSKAVITVGLPLLQLKGYQNENVQKRNRIIEKLAAAYGVPFIDAAALQRQSSQTITSYSWKHKNLERILDGIVMLVFPFSKDWFSRLRHLELTVDGTHYNSRSAKLIGNAITDSLRRNVLHEK